MEANNIQPRFKDSAHFTHFWGKGNGKRLIEWTGAKVNFEKFDDYAPLFYQVDEVGDAVVRDLFLEKPFHEAMGTIEKYIRNGIPDSDNVPDSVQQLFSECQTVPNWVDQDLLKRGAEVCMKSGVDGLISLRDYSLMGGYDFAYLSNPLVFTNALQKGAIKRLKGTLEFWVEATRYDAMEVHAKGYEMAIKTRLIHSYARHKILQNVPSWNTKEWGKPINLWDMTATSSGFSLVFLHGLHLLNHSITKDDELSVMHLWKYIGYLLGIPPQFLPNTLKEAVEQFYCWTSIQAPADKDSVRLAYSLLNETIENSILKYQFQRKFLRKLHNACCIHFLDTEVAKRLALNSKNGARWFPKSLRIKNKMQCFLVRHRIIKEKRQIAKGNRVHQKVLKDYRGINY